MHTPYNLLFFSMHGIDKSSFQIIFFQIWTLVSTVGNFLHQSFLYNLLESMSKIATAAPLTHGLIYSIMRISDSEDMSHLAKRTKEVSNLTVYLHENKIQY